jgi:hypothetical protein
MTQEEIEAYRKDHGNVHLDYETVPVMEVTFHLIEVDPRELTDMQRGNAFRRPEDDGYYHVEFRTLAGEVVATHENTSSNIWSASYNGVLKDGDSLAIEMDIECELHPEKPKGERWVSIFAEALMVMYTRVKFDETGHAMFHKTENLIRVGDEDREFHRSFGDVERKPRYDKWLEKYGES